MGLFRKKPSPEDILREAQRQQELERQRAIRRRLTQTHQQRKADAERQGREGRS